MRTINKRDADGEHYMKEIVYSSTITNSPPPVEQLSVSGRIEAQPR
jgi:hypothetical protein